MEGRSRTLGIVALVLGLVGLAAWCLPICGFPLSIGGIVVGVLGIRGEGRTLAIVGVVLNTLALIASIVNAAWGMYMVQSGQHPLFPNGPQGGMDLPGQTIEPANLDGPPDGPTP